MTTTNLEQRVVPSSRQDHRRTVVDAVLARLGRPASLFRIDAKPVGESRYRVNVYCTEDIDRPVKRVQITDSFFVTVSEAGIESVPEINRKYS